MAELAPAPNIELDTTGLVGVPFRLGARGPDAYDCYGLVMEIARRSGVTLPDYRSPEVLSQVAGFLGEKQQLWTPCKPGPGAVVCIRVLRHVSHVAMLLPYDRIIHVWERSGGVCIERLSEWQHRVAGFYRYD